MALHLFLMPIVSAPGPIPGINIRQPKYASTVDIGWAMCDGGSFATVLADLSSAAYTSIIANSDCVELPIAALNVAPNAVTRGKVNALLTGYTVSPSATAGQMARITPEANQPSLAGKPIILAVPSGNLTL